jgi:hypothetical protein
VIEWGELEDGTYAVRHQGFVYHQVNGRWKRDNTLARQVHRFVKAPASLVWEFTQDHPTIDFPELCWKCRGKGVTKFKHVAEGVCFLCNGAGQR